MTRFGYLPKLRALVEMHSDRNAMAVAHYLGVSYECARSALRRLELAGFVSSERRGDRWRPEVLYSITDEGRAVLSRGVEISLVSKSSRPRDATRVSRRDNGEDVIVALWDWRPLHDALSMGEPCKPKRNKRLRAVKFDLDMDRLTGKTKECAA